MGGVSLTRILLVRHGQTAWNREERFRGQTDLDLTEIGLSQAKAAGRTLAFEPLTAIYSSPLKRAMDTARAIAQPHSLAVQPITGLLDINYGAFQGLSQAEAQARHPDLYSQWRSSPHLVTFPNGEGLEDVRRRAVSTLEQIIAQHQGATVVLVSHQVVCKILVCHVLGLGNAHFWQVEQDLCAINLFEEGEGRLIATMINHTCHLKDLPSS